MSLAGHTAQVAGSVRVGPVYTPPEHRRRGYGAAVTAATTLHALADGATQVVLFTDLANPVSNSIYQAIGYVAGADFVELGLVSTLTCTCLTRRRASSLAPHASTTRAGACCLGAPRRGS